MTVRFKFRSSLNFDTVDIEGRPSISLRDLKSKIVRFKNLNLCQDFDLVLSDSLTGQEYVNENAQIPDGSSVIIKRVPAESARANSTNENLRMKEEVMPISTVSPNVETVDFDDFGVDLYPIAEVTLSSFNLDVEKKTCTASNSPIIDIAAMCFKRPLGGCQKFAGSDLSDTIAQRPDHNGVEGDSFQEKMELKVQDVKKKVDTTKSPTLHNDNLPPELNCSICNSFFKEAVMIPCCQHSFCQKCINQVLLERARCPKCFSTKCRDEDLLPNLSLRQAIEHFLDSQMLTINSDNGCQQYAPDGESGIKAKDVSCGVSVSQTVQESPLSPAETGRGSNHIMVESPSKPTFKVCASNHNETSYKLPPLLNKMKQIDKSIPKDLVDFDDCQGESQPMHEEGNGKRELWSYNEGGRKSFVETRRNKKGARTCYMCGSPDHFIKDCPVAFSPCPMRQTGNAMFQGTMAGYIPYWNVPPMPHVRPYGNPYVNCGMLPFNARMVPTSPYTIPTYMSSMYRPILALGRCTRMPPGTSEDHCAYKSEFLEMHESEKRRKLSDQNLRREPCLADKDNEVFTKIFRVGDKETSNEHKSRVSKEKTLSCSDDSFAQKAQGKYRRMDNKHHLADEYHQKISRSLIGGGDRRQNHCPERVSSPVDDCLCSSSGHSDEGQKRHCKSSKKHDGKKEHCSHNNSNFSRKRIEHDAKRKSEKHHYSESDIKESPFGDQKKQRKEASQGSKHSEHSQKSTKVVPSYERWQMVSGSDEDGSEEYQYYKRKRGH